MYYQLIVELAEKDKSLLYQGISYMHDRVKRVRSHTQDTLEICRHKITLSFVRSRIDPETVLFTQKSNIRYQLQRALCFYLAVAGYMPKVKRIYITAYTEMPQNHHEKLPGGKKKMWKQEIEDISFAAKWQQYRLDECIPADVAEYIFTDGPGAKAVYDGMTYFEAAQQYELRDLRDCYRAAWSCLNALYTYIGGADKHEQDKLIELGKLLGSESFADARRYVEELPQDRFWDRLEWYQAACARDFRTKDDSIPKVYDDILRLKQDSMLVSKYDQLLCKIKRPDADQQKFEKDRKKHLRDIRRVIEADQSDIETRLRFLICRYCYMLRNKSMHAEKAYPMFMITGPDYESDAIEPKLIRVMLLTAVGLMREIMHG